ncbi:MAG: hypothetical protein CME66_04100 [Halobacteriovoraceae bacterium]|nr:hypothetical protein [Halobacteriovoraceae bacterium]
MKAILILTAIWLIPLYTFGLEKSPTVEVKTVTKQTIEKKLFFPVEVLSKVHSEITADFNYIVQKRIVKLGQKVKRGSPLLSLRNQDFSQHYEPRVLEAPVTGVVASIHVTNGQYISKGEKIMTINSPQELYGKIEISAVDYQRIKPNLKGFIQFSSLDGKKIPVKIKGIGTAVDPLTGTVSGELEILSQHKLVPGLIGLAEITLEKQKKYLVPEKALYYIGKDPYLAFIENKNQIKKKKISLGKRFGESFEVTQGLQENLLYVTSSPRFLKDGETVNFTPPASRDKNVKKDTL